MKIQHVGQPTSMCRLELWEMSPVNSNYVKNIYIDTYVSKVRKKCEALKCIKVSYTLQSTVNADSVKMKWLAKPLQMSRSMQTVHGYLYTQFSKHSTNLQTKHFPYTTSHEATSQIYAFFLFIF